MITNTLFPLLIHIRQSNANPGSIPCANENAASNPPWISVAQSLIMKHHIALINGDCCDNNMFEIMIKNAMTVLFTLSQPVNINHSASATSNHVNEGSKANL